MIHETKGGRTESAVIAPDLDSTQALSVLLPVVSRRHQSEQGTVLDRQGSAIQRISEQNLVGEQVRKRKAYGVAVRTSKNHERSIRPGTDSRSNDSLVEVRE